MLMFFRMTKKKCKTTKFKNRFWWRHHVTKYKKSKSVYEKPSRWQQVSSNKRSNKNSQNPYLGSRFHALDVTACLMQFSVGLCVCAQVLLQVVYVVYGLQPQSSNLTNTSLQHNCKGTLCPSEFTRTSPHYHRNLMHRMLLYFFFHAAF